MSRTTLNLDLSPPVRLDLWAIIFAAAVAAGTVVPAFAPVMVLASVIVCASALLWRDIVPTGWRLMAILAPLFVAGGVGVAFLHSAAPDPLAEFASLDPGEVKIVGKVISPPVRNTYGYSADVRVERLWYEGREVLRGGGVEVYAGDMSVGVGDEVLVDGDISRPEPEQGDFDYARYLSTKRISATVDAKGVWPVGENVGWVGQVYRRTDAALSYGLHPQEAAIVRGMVLGDRSRIPEALDNAFKRSGITHILAISGQHVAVLAAILYFVLRFFSVPLAARNPTVLGLVWLYIFIAGAPPSAIRAGVVATFVLLAPLFGRQVSPLHFMTTMLAAVLAYNPNLIYNTGFQLSVAAVLGILLLRKPFQAFIKNTLLKFFKKPPEAVSNLLAVSLAAQVATAPIIAATFGQVSVIGVLTNLIAVPLSGPILALGLLGALTGNVLPALAYPINASNGFLVTIVEWVAQAFSALPFAAVATPGLSLIMIPLFYAGCVPAAIAEFVYPEERWTMWASITLLWATLWLLLANLSG